MSNFKAGYSRDRIVDCTFNDELVCTICMQTLRNPLSDVCEHLFCSECIHSWLDQNNICARTANELANESLIDLQSPESNLFQLSKESLRGRCPISGQILHYSDLHPVPRIVRNLLSKLKLFCEYQPFGCPQVCSYDQLQEHERNCKFDPNRLVECEHNCGAKYQQSQKHDCVAFLLKIVRQLNDRIVSMTSIIQSNQEQIAYISNVFDKLNRF